MIVDFRSKLALRKSIRHDKNTLGYPSPLSCTSNSDNGDSRCPTQSGRHVSSSLPPSLPPRGLSRVESAAYIEMVKDGRMPNPKRINSRTVWDRKRLDDAFEALPDSDGGNPWDEDEAA